jgi:hypothetical protein
MSFLITNQLVIQDWLGSVELSYSPFDLLRHMLFHYYYAIYVAFVFSCLYSLVTVPQATN